MEMIAPLAKVLAEANGIDWRRINGTGAGGQVIEQDILSYLSRIMTGEEELPSTPVDLPPADWAGDAPNLSVEALAAAGVESDIADFVATARSETVNLGAEDLTSDSMDFELELDDDNDDPVTRDPREMAEQPRDADYAGADVIETAHVGLPITPGNIDPVVHPATPLTETRVSEPGYVDPAQQTVPHVPADNMGLPQDAPTHNDAQDGIPSTPSTGDSGWHDQKDEPTGLAASGISAGETTASSIAGGLLSSLYQSKPQAPAPTPEVTPVASQPVETPEPAFTPEPVAAQVATPEPVVTQVVTPEPVQPVIPEEPVAVATPEPVAAPTVESEPAPVAVPVATVTPAHVEFAPAARHATLRLSFDATALEAARTHLAEHFAGREAPLAVFAARAAARHAQAINASSVGVYGVGDEITAIATPNLTGEFRAAVTDVHAAEQGAVSDLMVIDAGELGLDELQLPGEGTTLVLGRVKDGAATLTLTGPVSVRAGAAFLQSVTALLETPIRLML